MLHIIVNHCELSLLDKHIALGLLSASTVTITSWVIIEMLREPVELVEYNLPNGKTPSVGTALTKAFGSLQKPRVFRLHLSSDPTNTDLLGDERVQCHNPLLEMYALKSRRVSKRSGDMVRNSRPSF